MPYSSDSMTGERLGLLDLALSIFSEEWMDREDRAELGVLVPDLEVLLENLALRSEKAILM